jgi:glyoxylase-like metal-dependent hydrolase (beta-lactamase superfamily II)
MRVQGLTVGPLAENAYLVWEGGEGVLVDPGAEPERLEAAIEKAGFAPAAILLTHAHFDHLGAVAPLARAGGLPVFLNRADLPLYQNAPALAAAFGLSVPEPPEPAGFLDEGAEVFGLKVLHLPGHSPGHLAFYAEAEGFVLSGDLLFKGGIGRYDLPGADPEALFASLRRLLLLPEATRVLPGHGPATTIAEEKRTNPFLADL